MTLGRHTRGGTSGLVSLALVALSGCHAMPLGRLEAGPNPASALASASRAALLSATVAMEPPSEMSSFEPVKTSAENLTSIEEIRSAPTPLLDAALQKARASDAPALPAMPEPVKTEPTTPAEPPPSAIFASKLPIELPTVNPARTQPVAEAHPTEPEPAPKEPEPARPEDLWRDGVRKLNTLAHAKVEQAGGSASPWGLRSRILSWLAEPDINPDLNSRDLDGVRAVLRALDEPPQEAGRKGDTVRSAVLVLEDKAPLEIVDLRLCRTVDNFGKYEAFDPPVRKPGQAVAIYCEIDGLRFEQAAGGFRTRLAGQLEIIPEAGGPPIHVQPLGTAEEVCKKRRRDYYVVYRLEFPKTLPPGDYRIRLTERDLASDQSATRDASFFIIKD